MSKKNNAPKNNVAKAASKKAAAKKAAAKRSVREVGTITIKITGDFSALRGKRAATAKRIKNGITVEALQNAMVKLYKSADWRRRTWQVLDAMVAKEQIALVN
jgi:hypothetical protein